VREVLDEHETRPLVEQLPRRGEDFRRVARVGAGHDA
jgi:hypothetical protein